MPLTFTGRVVRPDNEEVPSLVDIAVGLSRMPRFSGQTRRWWSVLDHSFFCDALVQKIGVAYLNRKYVFNLDMTTARLALLLHDAHEAMTSDVPTDYKVEDMRTQQEDLDQRIYGRYFRVNGLTRMQLERVVKEIDGRALRAEALVVGPPNTDEVLKELFGYDYDTPRDMQLLLNLLDEGEVGHTPSVLGAEDQHNVREYVNRIITLL